MKRLRDIDSAERVMVFRIATLIGVPMLFVVLVAQGGVSWLALPDVVGTGLAVWIVWWLIRHAGASAGSITWPRGTPVVREYSEQDALVQRGLILDAVDSYRSHIVAFPTDVQARLRLAALLADHTRDVDSAEQMYLEVRGMNPSPQDAWVVANGLIDLYRAARRRDQLKSELAAFAHHHRDVPAGKAARTHLRQLAAEDDAAR
jgi:hypothetical protein